MKLRYLTLAVVIAAAVVVLFTATGGSARTPQAHSSAGTVLGIRHTPLGNVLVGTNGHTLYLFEADKTDVSTLSAAGRRVWPPFTAAGQVKAGAGVQAARLGTSVGPSGIRQVVYDGHPLYYYVGDSKPGSTRGQGLREFGALWFVVGPNGRA